MSPLRVSEKTLELNICAEVLQIIKILNSSPLV